MSASRARGAICGAMEAAPHSEGLSHVAMSLPEGSLTPHFREAVVAFYGRHFGWTEIESLQRSDRMTLAIGGRDYVNLRERPDPVAYGGYEHFGLLLASPEAVDETWAAIGRADEDVHLEELKGDPDGYRSFRFRYLLPLIVEVQHLP
jgi:hypothetical protein